MAAARLLVLLVMLDLYPLYVMYTFFLCILLYICIHFLLLYISIIPFFFLYIDIGTGKIKHLVLGDMEMVTCRQWVIQGSNCQKRRIELVDPKSGNFKENSPCVMARRADRREKKVGKV